MGLLFLIRLRRFHGLDAQVADRLVGNATFATAIAIEPVICHEAVFRAAGCDRVLAVKS